MKSSSIPACGRRSESTAPRRLEHDGDRSLVVRAEDRARGVANEALVVDDRLDLPRRRHRVEVRAEEDRRAGRRALEARVEIAGRRTDALAGVVLFDLERAVAQVPRDRIGDGAFLSGRARDGGELREEVEDVGHVRSLECRSCSTGGRRSSR